MKYNKNVNTLLLLLLFTTDQPETNIDKTFFQKEANSRPFETT